MEPENRIPHTTAATTEYDRAVASLRDAHENLTAAYAEMFRAMEEVVPAGDPYAFARSWHRRQEAKRAVEVWVGIREAAAARCRLWAGLR